MAIVASEKSSRQLCRHILPLADMEATSYIRRLLALGAVWNIDLNDCPCANAILCRSMCRDECRLSLDACPASGAVHVLIPVFEAGGHQEQSFVRDEIANADVMRCLQSALTFHHADLSQDLQGVACGGRVTQSAQIHCPRLGLGELFVSAPRAKDIDSL
jgi:hypothetical protein